MEEFGRLLCISVVVIGSIAYLFQNFFRCIHFLFIQRPFDVGDLIEMDAQKMMVTGINITTSVLLRQDNVEKVIPNVTLANKRIDNYSRVPCFEETVNFSIDKSTPPEKVAKITDTISSLIKTKSENWFASSSVNAVGSDDTNLKFEIRLKHKLNGAGKKTEDPLKELLDGLNITYSIKTKNF